LGGQRLILTIAKAGAATITMGIVSVAAIRILTPAIGTVGLASEAALVILSGGISVVVFLVMALLLRVEELRWLWQLIRQRLNIA
jgi:hypothetical protein